MELDNMMYPILALGGAILTTFAIVEYNRFCIDKTEKRSILAQFKRVQYHLIQGDADLKQKVHMDRKELLGVFQKFGSEVYASEWPMDDESIQTWGELKQILNNATDPMIRDYLEKQIPGAIELNKKQMSEMEKLIKQTNLYLYLTRILTGLGFVVYISSFILALWELGYY